MELTQEDFDRVTDIVASEVGFSVDPNNLPRPPLWHILPLLITYVLTRGRSAHMATEAGPNSKPSPTLQLYVLWNYAVHVKAENLRLANQ
jgi:hypothetical protein